VKRKIWLWSSLVLVVTVALTLALFNYWDQLKSETILNLQNRLKDIELSHFEQEKGNQVYATTQDVAGAFNQLIGQVRSQVEKLADSPALQQPVTRPADLNFKKQAFTSLTSSAGWNGCVLTSETGQILAATGRRASAGSLASSNHASPFVEALRGHQTAVRLELNSDNHLQWQVTVPLLREDGGFLGVLQADVPVNATQLSAITGRTGLLTILATAQGQRLFGGSPNFPQYMGSLIRKNPQEMENLTRQNAQRYFKASWEKVNYLMVSVPTNVPNVYVFTLLEVTGLARFVGPRSVATKMFADPVILGGLILIFLAGLFFMNIAGNMSMEGVRKINRQLNTMLEEGADLAAIQTNDAGELAKLADLVNLLIDRTRISGPSQVAPVSAPEDDQARLRAEAELTDMKNKLQWLQSEKDESDRRAADLAEQNQQLLQAASAPKVPDDYAQMEALVRDFKEASTLRIEAIQNMSEDLKATLTVIKNYISSILSSEEGKITDSQQEFLGVVINRSARLERQINDLLDISHMESEEDQGAFVKTDLVSMLQDVILNIQPQADTKQINLIAEIQSPLPQVMINGDRMGQVFINLVQHALKITPVGGEVRIAATETLSDLVIKIRDSGAPLTPDQAANVFVSFNGPGSLSGPDLAGTGLRFPIIKRIVDFHHGSITLRGVPDRGNETVISLPKSAGTEEYRPAPAFASMPVVESPLTETEMAPPAEVPVAPESKPDSETFFDLSAFMGQAGETPQDGSKLVGSEENLTDLLKDIDTPKN